MDPNEFTQNLVRRLLLFSVAALLLASPTLLASNTALIGAYFNGDPDLVVTGIDFGNFDCTNDSVSDSVSVTVKNQGTAAANDFEVALATDGCLSFATNQTVATLNHEDSTTVTFSISGSWANCSDCSCRFTATVDATYAVTESNETNNQLTETYTSNLPNLTVNSVAERVICAGDGNLTGTTVNVSNNGCADASNVALRLTSDCGLTFADQTVNLAAGETKDVFFPFTAGITTCSCNFTAKIDPDNTICECDGTDNTGESTSPMTIPDIEVQSDTLVVSCVDDGQGTVSGTVTLVNNGCGPDLTDNVPMRFTLSGNTGCSGNQVAQWTQIFAGVSIPSAGGIQDLTIQPHNIVISPCVDSSNRQVSALIEADCNGTICEWDGTDNTLCTDKPLNVLVPVGGIMVPVSRLELLAPWLGLVALASLAALTVVVVRRRTG